MLGYEEINILDNFFELGADSIMLGLIFQGLDSLYPDLLQATDLFAYPTVKSLSEHIVECGGETDEGFASAPQETMDEQVASLENSDSDIDDGIAIIGVGLDLPNANSLEDY